MTFYQFALKNVIRNKRLYAAYFLSSMFTVMVFFTFANFAFHPVFSSDAFNQNALFGMGVAGGIIYIFSFFFILYSMSQFLKTRNKEFGLLMTQGMSVGQIRFMVFLENIVIGIFSTIFGIVFGLVFSKAILLIAENVLIIEETLYFYVPIIAVVLTFISFVSLFIVISFMIIFVLRNRKLIDLIKSDQKSKGEPKASLFLTIVAIILLGAGYFVALTVQGIEVVVAMVPVIIVVTIGTYFLFTQLSVYVINKIKRSTSVFWKKTNIILFSDLSYRIKDNARTFFIVAMISTVAFTAIGTLFSFQTYLTKGIKQSQPYSFEYKPFEDEEQNEIDDNIKNFENMVEEEGVELKKESMIWKYFDVEGPYYPVLIVKASDYNRFARLINKDTVDLQGNETLVVTDHPTNITNENNSQILMKSTLTLNNNEKLEPKEAIDSIVINEMRAYYIVSDDAYNMLPEPTTELQFYAWQGEANDQEKLVKLGGELYGDYYFNDIFSIDYLIYEINKSYGPILFIGLFIGVVFFVSAGSFLYFRLYADLEEDRTKFKAIAKIGLTNKELSKVVTKQIAMLFFVPVIVAVMHGVVALTALSHFFDYNIATVAFFVLCSFVIIQVIYFIVIRYFYLNQIKEAIKL